MELKKFCLLFLSLLLSLCACSFDRNEITVISREEASGTRSAFVELTGLLQGGTDRTYPRAEISSSNAVVLQSVVGNRNAIGYISLGAVSKEVKALRIDGVEPGRESIQRGSYLLARPFLLVSRGEQSPLTADFFRYILSPSGQDVIAQAGYVPTGREAPYESSLLSGTVKVMGSSSVAPVLEKLAEGYMEENPAAIIQVQTTDSSQGLSSLAQGLCQIAMSSRGLKDSEKSLGLVPVTFCMDGIAVIVNKSNPLTDLTVEELRRIFSGQLRSWEGLS